MTEKKSTRNIQTEERVIAGKTVKVAPKHAVKLSAQKITKQYHEALENLKDR